MSRTAYPLVFSFSEVVLGLGATFRVDIHGRATGLEEKDAFWVYGVNPGACAGSGTTVVEAFHDFRAHVRAVLIDAITGAGDFAAFESEVVRFVTESDEVSVSEWESARAAVRSKGTTLDGLGKVSGRVETRVSVVPVGGQANENRVDQQPGLAA